MAGKNGQEQPEDDVSPANMRNAIEQLAQLGFSREDCANALKQCQGHLVRNSTDDIWTTILRIKM